MNRTVFEIQVTLEADEDVTQYAMQQEFLEDLPLRFGRTKLNDARIVKGYVDQDDVPRKIA
jgi:hypothetical protein